MKSILLRASLLLFVLASHWLLAQPAYQVHSHNDYLQEVPFWHAYGSGANSIEVDLFFKNDTLFVTHAEAEIQAGRTLESLYLQPLQRLVQDGSIRPVQLLIDLKSEAYQSMEKLVAVLADHPALAGEEKIKFVVSGNRPKAADYAKYPAFIYFDHQNLNDLGEINLAKVAMISQNFKAYSVWNGYGRMTAPEAAKVLAAVEKARATGIPFRFWATPDTKTAWSRFAQLGVGYINTDAPAQARIFLDELDQRTHAAAAERAVYQPTYLLKSKKKPQNIILLIGDGNGLAQISAALQANRGKLSLAHLKTIGLVNTSAADDPVTDSAAAGTAIATGVKTNNRAIGVDPAGKSLPTLIEILSGKGYNTGIITTDGIDGATPSAFYAHTSERDDSKKILADLVQSELDFFISGGTSAEKIIAQKFVTQTLEEFKDLQNPTAIYNGAGKMPSARNGRGDFLPASVEKALTVLNGAKKPFFLLVEGAQIDNGGHANDIATIISEGLDFDQAVGEALRFADKTKNTLVIVTADHETGGLGIAGGDGDGTVRADFLSVDHTGILVPIFAYGPQAENFGGVFDNTEIFGKILRALGW